MKKLLKQAKELADLIDKQETEGIENGSIPEWIPFANTMAWHLYCDLKEHFGEKPEANIREISRQVGKKSTKN